MPNCKPERRRTSLLDLWRQTRVRNNSRRIQSRTRTQDVIETLQGPTEHTNTANVSSDHSASTSLDEEQKSEREAIATIPFSVDKTIDTDVLAGESLEKTRNTPTSEDCGERRGEHAAEEPKIEVNYAKFDGQARSGWVEVGESPVVGDTSLPAARSDRHSTFNKRDFLISREVRDVQLACERLRRTGGCVVCFARGIADWRTHKLSGCPRGVATCNDPVWRIWRTDRLCVPARACSSCCIPQNVSGGWHTFQRGSLIVNCCPTPDIVKPMVYVLVYDEDICRPFTETSLFASLSSSNEDYASWLFKRPTTNSIFNILGVFLWLVEYRSSQDGFSLG